MKDFIDISLRDFRTRPTTEADVKSNITYPVLTDILNIESKNIFEESTSKQHFKKLRPDYICRTSNSFANVILEAKNIDVDIYEKRNANEPINKHPLGQLAHYLTHHELSGNGTVGLLSNGFNWAVMVNKNNKAVPVEKFSAGNRVDLEKALYLAIERAGKIAVNFEEPKKPEESSWIQILRELASNNQLSDPRVVLDKLVSNTKTIEKIPDKSFMKTVPLLQLNGLPENIAAIPVNEFDSKYSDIFGKRRVFQICVRPNTYDGQISPDDITDCLSTSEVRQLIHPNDRCFGIAYSILSEETTEIKLRGFVWTGENLQVTEFFDLNMPKAINVRRLKEIANYSFTEESVSIPSMSLESLQKQFHEDLDKWFSQTRQTDSELRHLIRILFLWLLCDRNKVPQEVLPLHIPDGVTKTAVHNHLQWIFENVLAVPIDERSVVSNEVEKYVIDLESAETICQDTPFLNGSLFHSKGDQSRSQTLSNDHYIGNTESPGLFDILAKYQWTLNENSAYLSEVAIDPNMLGELFERFILRTEGIRYEGKGSKSTMPDGTYFTPSDVVDEMVSDALAHWLHKRVLTINISSLRQLAHPTPNVVIWEEWDDETRLKILHSIKLVTILDPCCGSGAFTVAAMQAIARIVRRLNIGEISNESILDEIVAKQIFAVDKKSLAVAITKLRLYIAIVDSQLRRNPNAQLKPLPNLEVRIIVANTLRLNIETSQQTMFRINNDPEWINGLHELAAVRELWTDGAHDAVEKSEIRRQDEIIRNSLLEYVERNRGKFPEVNTDWLKLDMTQEPICALELDVRECFLRDNWDVVIGNPPYQKISRDDRTEYGDGYLTEGCNLYTLFLEVAMELVAPRDGTVTVVVPHSIVFRQNQIKYRLLRKEFEFRAENICYRTYDNRPQPLFPKLPWLGKNKENSQRATILTVDFCIDKVCRIYSSGYIRMGAGNRHKFLKQYIDPIEQPKIENQWSHAPTEEMVRLLSTMNSYQNKSSISHTQPRTIGFPATARNFITAIPEPHHLQRKSNTLLSVNCSSEYWAWVGLYNSRVFFAYWRMIGDAFHITVKDYTTVKRPTGWDTDDLVIRTRDLAQQLWSQEIMSKCETVQENGTNKLSKNWDFYSHTEGREIIDQLDDLIISAYELSDLNLLDQLDIIRRGSAHDFYDY